MKKIFNGSAEELASLDLDGSHGITEGGNSFIEVLDVFF